MITSNQNFRKNAKNAIIGILREVFKADKFGDLSYRYNQFSSSKSPAIGGIYVLLAFSPKAETQIRSFSVMLSEEIEGDQLAAVVSRIDESIQRLTFDKNLINQAELYRATWKSLFDIRAIRNAQVFAEKCLELILNDFKNAQQNILIAIPAPRLHIACQIIPEIDVQYLSRSDMNLWKSVLATGDFKPGSFNPNTGEFLKAEPFSQFSYNGYFVFFQNGFISSVKQVARFRFSILVAAIVVQKERAISYSVGKSMGKASTSCVILRQDSMDSLQYIGEIIPQFFESIVLDSAETAELKRWFAKLNSASNEMASRLEKSAYFFCKAINSSGFDAFLWNSVAIDSLFGAKGRVKQSIINGVSLVLDFEPKIKERIKLLLDLRNEIAHGESRSIEEWDMYSEYIRRFDVQPQSDLRRITSMCLRQYLDFPNLFVYKELSLRQRLRASIIRLFANVWIYFAKK